VTEFAPECTVSPRAKSDNVFPMVLPGSTTVLVSGYDPSLERDWKRARGGESGKGGESLMRGGARRKKEAEGGGRGGGGRGGGVGGGGGED